MQKPDYFVQSTGHNLRVNITGIWCSHYGAVTCQWSFVQSKVLRQFLEANLDSLKCDPYVKHSFLSIYFYRTTAQAVSKVLKY